MSLMHKSCIALPVVSDVLFPFAGGRRSISLYLRALHPFCTAVSLYLRYGKRCLASFCRWQKEHLSVREGVVSLLYSGVALPVVSDVYLFPFAGGRRSISLRARVLYPSGTKVSLYRW